MKIKLLAAFTITVCCIIAITFTLTTSTKGAYMVYAHSNGSLGGYTNSFRDAKSAPTGQAANCTRCHTGALNTPINTVMSIESPLLVGGYIPNKQYTIIVKANNIDPSIEKIGFEATVEQNNTPWAKAGTIIITDLTRTQTTNAGNAITHKILGTTVSTSNNISWSFDWIAPAAQTGPITFYAAFNISNNDGTEKSDAIYTRSFSAIETIETAIRHPNNETPYMIYPNPVKDFLNIKSTQQLDKIELYNTDGKRIFSETNPKKIDLSNEAAGVYFINITLNNKTSIQKLIKN